LGVQELVLPQWAFGCAKIYPPVTPLCGWRQFD